jgi:hypothetical protein
MFSSVLEFKSIASHKTLYVILLYYDIEGLILQGLSSNELQFVLLYSTVVFCF